ncbi:MAG: DUF3656 domain-containing protein, partial [Chloroflexaceae bacterium]
GQCAQACRLPYELIVDGALRPLGDARYLLSPGDLSALRLMPEIVRLGVAALKIEGRYKDETYVALATSAYRKAVDEAWAGLPLSLSPAEELRLEQVYSRGLGPYFLSGTNHQAVVRGRAPRHRGVLVGRVVRVLADRVQIAPEPATAIAPLKPGDGVVFDAADRRSPEEPEEGGRIYHVRPARDGLLEVEFGNQAVNVRRVRAGDLLWRTDDPEVERAARPFTRPAAPLRRQPVAVRAVARAGAPLELEWRLMASPARGGGRGPNLLDDPTLPSTAPHGSVSWQSGSAEQSSSSQASAPAPELCVTVRSPEPLATARRHALTVENLREQLGRLGATPYTLAELEAIIEGEPFVPDSLLNTLRRQAVERLAALQGQPRSGPVTEPLAALEALLASCRSAPEPAHLPPQLHLLVRTPEHLEAALALRPAPASITLDYLDLDGLRPAVERVQAAGIPARVASPRVLKPGEERIVRFLLKLGCGILVRSTGLLQALRQSGSPPLTGDFSLNAANLLSAATLLDLGLERLTPTHDLNAAQVADLARAVGPRRTEVVAYQHLPVFHTEHCVFCRFLSSGTSYKDCGRPCERHQVALRDQRGREHPVLADVGCRNTVFSAEAQTASRHLAAWRAAGIVHYRLEFVHESGTQVTDVATAFRATLEGTLSQGDLERRLRQIVPDGLTEGSLFVPAGHTLIPLLD